MPATDIITADTGAASAAPAVLPVAQPAVAQPPVAQPPVAQPAVAPLPVARPAVAYPAGGVSRGSDRLRWGLTGLAAIFLLVLIAAAGLRPAAPAKSEAPVGEPLAVLGVAPGAASPDAAPESPAAAH